MNQIISSFQDEIMVIDDTIANLHLIANLLGENGYQVRPFPSGKLALAGIHHSSPALILLDIQMPQMNGYEVCQLLKANELTRDIPVIFISALDEMMDKVKAFTVGGVDYITKPFQAEEVLARISTHLELSRLQKILKQENFIQAQKLAKQNFQLQEINQALEQTNQELKQKYYQLQQAQLQMIQSEKMSSLGNLVAGVAHEINNPVGFISGNINEAIASFADITEYLQLYQKRFPDPGVEITEKAEEFDIEYLIADFPQMLYSMKLGCDRIKGISTSLRTFSRADTDHPVACNIHDGIDSTIMILKHRLKANENRPEIEVVKEYGHLPQVECYAGQLNQVFMNLLANAIDALDESNQGMSYQKIANQITIKTELSTEPKQIIIRIQDNGIGMSEQVRSKIFDELFTTKVVGKGTGLGLAIARQIIVEKHRGSLNVNSIMGEGTEFIITLPTET